MIAAPIGYPYVLMHEACGQPAFFLRFPPDKSARLEAANCIAANGTALRSREPVVCSSCGDALVQDDLVSDAVILATDVTEPDTGEP